MKGERDKPYLIEVGTRHAVQDSLAVGAIHDHEGCQLEREGERERERERGGRGRKRESERVIHPQKFCGHNPFSPSILF